MILTKLLEWHRLEAGMFRGVDLVCRVGFLGGVGFFC